jgi:GntR family transcriptional regulator / MocR family aminotransferase
VIDGAHVARRMCPLEDPVSGNVMEPVLPFKLDLSGTQRGGLARALHRQLRSAVLDGRLPAGFALPSTRALASALGVGRNTVINAYERLVSGGHAHSRPGASTTVTAAVERRARRPSPAAAVAASGGHAHIPDVRIVPAWRRAADLLAPAAGLPARNFRVGVPEHLLFPHDIWRRLAARGLRLWGRQPFTYGSAQGLPALREAIAGHVAFVRAVACTGDDLIVTSGAQQAFDLLARLLVEPGRTCVAVEDPGYPPLRAAFAGVGARLVGVPVDAEGLLVDRLPPGVRVICVTPSHQWPTGAIMSAARRTALLAYAQRHGSVIVEDDYDGEFSYEASPHDALQTLDRAGCVFYVGTFSKSLFPALRKGFLVAPAWSGSALLDIKRCVDSHGDVMTQSTLSAFIAEGHLARHISRMRRLYLQRRNAMSQALARHLGTRLVAMPGNAGLHLAAQIVPAARSGHFINLAQQYLPGCLAISGLATHPLERPALCIGYGNVEVEQIDRSIQRLGAALLAKGGR